MPLRQPLFAGASWRIFQVSESELSSSDCVSGRFLLVLIEKTVRYVDWFSRVTWFLPCAFAKQGGISVSTIYRCELRYMVSSRLFISPNTTETHKIQECLFKFPKTSHFFFNSLLGVFKCDETHSLVFDVIYQTLKTVFDRNSKHREES